MGMPRNFSSEMRNQSRKLWLYYNYIRIYYTLIFRSVVVIELSESKLARLDLDIV